MQEADAESAAAGGVTAVVDMPNTNPFTSNVETFNDKVSTADDSKLVRACMIDCVNKVYIKEGIKSFILLTNK